MISELLVGISGHRDLKDADIPRLEKEIEHFFDMLTSDCPDVSLKLLSGMAEGADRITARVALKKNIPVVAVLPKHKEAYETDFEGESLTEFRTLLETDGVETLDLNNNPEDGNQCYVELGRYLSRNSAIVMALWNGIDTGKAGGTSDVVACHLGIARKPGVPIIDFSFDDRATGNAYSDASIVYWIPVERRDDDTDVIPQRDYSCFLDAKDGSSVLSVSRDKPSSLKETIRKLSLHNKQYAEIDEPLKKEVQEKSPLHETKVSAAHPRFENLAYINSSLEMSDALARFNQNKSDKVFLNFSRMAALMGFLFLVYAKLFSSNLLLIFYLFLFFTGVFLLQKNKREKWFEKHLVERLIAEILRVRFFLYYVGLDNREAIDRIIRNSGVDQFKGFAFLSVALRSSLYKELVAKKECSSVDIDTVVKTWVTEQKGWYERKAKRLEEKHHRIETIKLILMTFSVAAVFGLIMFKSELSGLDLFSGITAKSMLVFLMGLLPFLLGVWELYQGKTAVKELLWQYDQQAKIFERAEKRIANANNIEFKQKELEVLGERTLMESCLWAIHRYHREVEFQAGA